MTTTGPLLSTQDYDVREVTEQDEGPVLDLLTRSLAGGPTGERTSAFLRWKHRDSPFGPSPGLVAVAPDGSLAAVRLLLRWRLQVGSTDVPAVRAVDTATHPAHQGRGLFRRLTLQALDTVAADAALVFNTPNAISRPGYLRMGWHEVGSLPIRVRVAQPVRFVRLARGSGQAPVTARTADLDSPFVRAADLLAARGADVARLLAESEAGAPGGSLRTVRTPAYLQWRFGDVADLDYRAVVVDDAEGLRALGLGRLRRRGRLVELTLGEVLHRPGDASGARAVLSGAARSGADHVTVHLHDGAPTGTAASLAGYLPVPGRGLRLVALPRRPLPVDATLRRSWALTLGDLEVF